MRKLRTLALAASVAAGTFTASSLAGITPADAKIKIGTENAQRCLLESGGDKAKFKACMVKYHVGKAKDWLKKRIPVRL
jgi:hypothetical protein